MFSTLRKLFGFKKEHKTPMGFCDGPSSETENVSCCHCRTEDRYSQPYDPENKFHEAVCMGKLKVVLHLLAKNFHVDDVDESKRTALHFECFYGHLDVVYFLLFIGCKIDALDDQKSTPLAKAIQSWETKIVSVLLDHGADPNIKDSNGDTAIHHAVYVDSPDITRCLLEFGGNIEDTTKRGFTPLLLALRERKLRIAEYLITHGANLHVCDEHQRTPLMYAVKWDCKYIVQILLKRGVDYHEKDKFGWSALQYAIVGNRKVKSLIWKYEDSLLSKNHSIFTRKQPEDVFSSGNHFKSESLNSVCARMEDRDHLKIQQDISENILESGTDDLPIAFIQHENTEAQEELELETILDLKLESENVCNNYEDSQKLKAAQSSNIGNNAKEDEINQVWAEKCPHPELRNYCHLISQCKSETQQSQTVWAEKCPHPELGHYSHRISKPESETQQSQTVWAEKCPHPELRHYSHLISKLESQPDTHFSEELEEEIIESKLENERSFEKIADNQEFSMSDPNGLQESSTEAPHSSNMDNDAGKNLIRHLERKSVMEDQKHASEEEQRQHSGRKTKWPFVSKYLNLLFIIYAVSTVMFHRTNKVKFSMSFRINTLKANVF
nr:POTE ankyrin domain family member I-like isoform X3 [Peromyscus maniculatus bairdii]